MDGNDFFDSILGDLNLDKKEKKDSDKYKTTDFLLDDIMKEFGFSDTSSNSLGSGKIASSSPSPSASVFEANESSISFAPKADQHSQKPNIDFDYNSSPKTTAPKPKKDLYNDDFWDSILESSKGSKTVSQSPKVDIPSIGAEHRFEKHTSPKPEVETVQKVEGFNIDKKIAELEAKKTQVSQEKPNIAPSAPVPKPIAQVSSPVADITPTPKPEIKKIIDPEVPLTQVKPIKRILTDREEEDFKMSSGYIDLNAIKAATSARAPIKIDNKKQPHPTTTHDKSMNTQQKALYGKIGSFFSDATFQFDTSSVNGLTKDTVNGQARRIKKDKNGKIIPPEGINLNEEIDDIYNSKDLPDVEQELMYQVNISVIKAIITALLAVPLAFLNLFPDLMAKIAPSLSMDSSFNYAIANLFILLIIGLINFNIIGRGVSGIFTLRPTGSSLASLSVLISIAHCIYILVTGAEVTAMYCFVAALSIVFVLLGKSIYYKNVYRNFEILAFDSPKSACINVAGGYSLKELYTENQKISACRPVAIITRFLNNSFDYNFSDKVSKISILGALAVAVCSIVLAVLLQKTTSILSFAAAASCAITPFCYDLSYSLPMFSVSNKIRRYGSSVVSYTKAQDFAKTTTLVFCDSDLFKPENIIVHSMKINGNDKINDVIVNCASLIHESGSPVAKAFLNILDNKTEMLLPVYHFDWIPEKGYTGYINNTKYFVGTSQYLIDCGIKLPTVDLEEKYNRAGRKVIMFADSTKLLAVFSISYCRDEQIYANLHKINLDGFDILVLTRDSNISSELLAGVYEVNTQNFLIASKSEFERLYHNNKVKEKHPAGIYSITGASGITYALANCKRLINTVKISVVMRTLTIVCCAIVFLALTIFSQDALSIFSPEKMTFFHLMWLVPPFFISIFAG